MGGCARRERIPLTTNELKMVDFKKACTNPTLEKDGVWVELSEIFTGIEVKVARLNNKKAQNMYKDRMKPYRKYEKQHVNMPPHIKEEIESVVHRVYAETILLDWKNIEEDGKVVPYSIEKATEFLKNSDFFDQINFLCTEAETFRTLELEDNAKNLKKASSGS